MHLNAANAEAVLKTTDPALLVIGAIRRGAEAELLEFRDIASAYRRDSQSDTVVWFATVDAMDRKWAQWLAGSYGVRPKHLPTIVVADLLVRIPPSTHVQH